METTVDDNTVTLTIKIPMDLIADLQALKQFMEQTACRIHESPSGGTAKVTVQPKPQFTPVSVVTVENDITNLVMKPLPPVPMMKAKGNE